MNDLHKKASLFSFAFTLFYGLISLVYAESESTGTANVSYGFTPTSNLPLVLGAFALIMSFIAFAFVIIHRRSDDD